MCHRMPAFMPALETMSQYSFIHVGVGKKVILSLAAGA
jgi:hypothetical protein